MPAINQLNSADRLSASDLIPLFSQANGDARKTSLSRLAAFLATLVSFNDDKITQYAAPSASGFTVNLETGSIWLLLTPVAGYAAGTIKLNASPVDKDEVLVNCTQVVTALTVDGNGMTVTGAPTTLAANAFFRLRYDGVTQAWYRVS